MSDAIEADGSITHWAFCSREETATPFLLFAAIKAVRDASAALDVEPAEVCELVMAGIERGAGE